MVFNDSASQLIQKFREAKDQVAYLLEHYPATRNNDFYLQWMWLKVFGGLNLPFIEWNVIRQFGGRLETLRRVRQKIQNEEHRFPPDEETKKHRQSRASKIRDNIHSI